jgi:hypothetical protein
MPIDLKKQTPSGLRNLLANAQRLGNTEMAVTVVQQMHERKMATSREYAIFPWNQDRVNEVMEPFARIAATVPNNQRVNYTTAGGRRIGLPKDHPEHLWIDSYSAIKVGETNAVFGCSIRRPGEDPVFTLYLGDRHQAGRRGGRGGSSPEAEASQMIYNADQLQQAIAEWKDIAHSASASMRV